MYKAFKRNNTCEPIDLDTELNTFISMINLVYQAITPCNFGINIDLF